MALSRTSDCTISPESSSAEGLDDEQSTRGGNRHLPIDSKRKRFHPLRAVRKIFKRRVKREGVESVSSTSKKSRSTSELQAVQDDGHRFQGPAPPYAVGLSVSHDSIFTPESPRLGADDISGIQGSSLSVRNMGLQGFQDELFSRVQLRRDSDDDIGLPHSPCTSPTTVDVLSQGLKDKPVKSHSACSAGSLGSMGSSENDEDSSGHSSRLSLIDRRSDFDIDGDASQPVPLSHKAAHHKIAIRPKRTYRIPRHWRLQQVTNFSGNLPSTPEVTEDSTRSSSPPQAKPQPPPQPQTFPEFSCISDADEPLSLPADLSLCSSSSEHQASITTAASEPAIDDLATTAGQRNSLPMDIRNDNIPGMVISRSKSAAAELKLRHEINQFSRRQMGNRPEDETPFALEKSSNDVVQNEEEEIQETATSSEEIVIDVKESIKELEATLGSGSKAITPPVTLPLIVNGENEIEEVVDDEEDKGKESPNVLEELGETYEDEQVLVEKSSEISSLSQSGESVDDVLCAENAENVPEKQDNPPRQLMETLTTEKISEDDVMLTCVVSNGTISPDESNSESDRDIQEPLTILPSMLDQEDDKETLANTVEVIVSADNVTTIESIERTIEDNNSHSSNNIVIKEETKTETKTYVERIDVVSSREEVLESVNQRIETQMKLQATDTECSESKTEAVRVENDVPQSSKPSPEPHYGRPFGNAASKRVSVEIVPFSQRIKDPNYLSPTKDGSYVKHIKQFEERAAKANSSTSFVAYKNPRNSEQVSQEKSDAKTNVFNGGIAEGASEATNKENSAGKMDKKVLSLWEVKIQAKQTFVPSASQPESSIPSSRSSISEQESCGDKDSETSSNPEIKHDVINDVQGATMATKDNAEKPVNDAIPSTEKAAEMSVSQPKDSQKHKTRAVVDQNSNEPELFRVFARRSLKHKDTDKKKEEDEDITDEKRCEGDPDIINTSDNSTIIIIQETAKNNPDVTADKKEPVKNEKEGTEVPPAKPSPKESVSSKLRQKGRFHTTSEVPLSEFESVTLRQKKNAAESEGKENIISKGLEESKSPLRNSDVPVNVTVMVKQQQQQQPSAKNAVKTTAASSKSSDMTNSTKSNKDGSLPMWMQLAQQRRELREQRERRLIGDAPATIVLETSNKPSRSSKVLDMVSNFQKMHLT